MREKNGFADVVSNADIRTGEIQQFCSADGQRLMHAAVTHQKLSVRAYHRILRLARTIADLAGSKEIQFVHLPEGAAV